MPIKRFVRDIETGIPGGGNLTPGMGKRFTVTAVLPGTMPATAANYGVVFIAPKKCVVKSVREAHTTLGTDGSAVGLNLEKLTGTQALDGGTALLSANINLKGAVNTVQSGTLITTAASLQLNAGDRLALKDSGTLTAVAGVSVTIELEWEE